MKWPNWGVEAAAPGSDQRLTRCWSRVGLLLFLLVLAACHGPPEPVVQNATAVPTPLPPTDTPGSTAIPPTTTSTPRPTATIASTVQPTDRPTIPPTATATPEPQPPWLAYLNQFRQQAGLPALAEDPVLSADSAEHSLYMVRNDNAIARYEKRDNPYFTEAGNRAAYRSNIYAMLNSNANHVWAINFWMSAPFHALPILDPALTTVGYGDIRDDLGRVRVAAVLDVTSGLAEAGETAVSYPFFYPPDGGHTWILRQTLIEYPEPLTSCPGYHKPVGAPLILQLGSGSLTLDVTGYSLWQGDQPLAACAFDETNYTNPNPDAQERGRAILDARDAVVIIPQEPLAVGEVYTAQVTIDGVTYEWRFTAVAPPPITAPPLELSQTDWYVAFNVRGFNWGGQTQDFRNLGLMQSLGMGWLKFQQKWRSDSRPEELADRIRQAHAAGFKVLVSLTGDPYPETIDFAAFVEFLSGVAALNPPPDAIEVWNEMNIDFEWPTGQIDPAQYVNDMLSPAYTAIKAANSRIIVISGAPAPTGFDNGTNAWAVDRYVKGMADAGAANYLDCVGIHYNEGATSPYDASGHPAGGYFGWYFQPSLQMYYHAFGGIMPLCITEMGYLSGDGYGDVPDRFWWAQDTTVRQQAQWLAEALTLANEMGLVRLAIVFNVDILHYETDPQAGYAIIRARGGCPFCDLVQGTGP